MTPSKNCLDLIKRFEGCKLKAYVDPGTGNEPITIGWGTTIYDNGSKVKLGDVISQVRADELLTFDVGKVAAKMPAITVSQSQYDALVSFAYNVGMGNLNKSTLLKKVRANAADPTIHDEFMKWVKAGGKTMNGLIKRREAESTLYFSM